jgi:hypothetical protein
MTALFVAREIRWSGLTAQIAINALIIHVKPTRRVFWIPVYNVSHKITSFQLSAILFPAAKYSLLVLAHQPNFDQG